MDRIRHRLIIFFVTSYKLTISFVNKLWFHYQISDFTMISLGSLYLLRDFTMDWIHVEFNTFMRINHGYILLLATSLSIHYLWYEFTRNSFTSSQIYYEFTFNYANSLWIDYLYREVSMDSLSFLHPLSFHYEFAIFMSIWI